MKKHKLTITKLILTVILSLFLIGTTSVKAEGEPDVIPYDELKEYSDRLQAINSSYWLDKDFDSLTTEERNSLTGEIEVVLAEEEKYITYCEYYRDTMDNSSKGACANIVTYTSKFISNFPEFDEVSCTGFGEFSEWMQKFFTFVKILGPTVAIVLGMIDFAKATVSGKDDANKSAWKRFMTRMIAAAVLFLIPVIIELLLSITGVMGGTCGIS